mgnify:CR=1 FL=1
MRFVEFYSHVNYSVTKIDEDSYRYAPMFYSHVNYSVTKIFHHVLSCCFEFYSHVNYSVTKITLAQYIGY